MWTFIDSELRWGENYKNELWINYWNNETEIQADFGIRWYQLDHEACPKLEIFEDSWLALYQCGQDFLKMLAENDGKCLSKEQIKNELLKIGFVDKTLDDID